MGCILIELEVFKRTHVKKKENKSDPDVWVAERPNELLLSKRCKTTPVNLQGVGSSRQAETLDGVQIAAMSAQIAQLTSALTELERRRVAEQ
ncbi:hypothetical protein MTR67_035363 [Solanum verrucosum]|uniref:Uncharacterized protein n=1 Tax=Solanum verrucosum TaxID=315347 RepID=A0AAF0U9E0_SOLVR|nr:hypothetical protein MTR67_035363 [Solanum verrucosum]